MNESDFSLQLPLNTNLSFGQVSLCLCLELWKMGLEPNIFIYPEQQNLDLVAFNNLKPEFIKWLTDCINKGLANHKRTNPAFKLWHIRDLIRISDYQCLGTFHETSEATPTELNIVSNCDKILLSSTYSNDIFQKAGAKNTGTFFVGFDKESFQVTNQRALSEDIIVFNLAGKWEERKQTGRILRLWAKKYGDNVKFALHCAFHNPFLDNIDKNLQSNLIHQALEGKHYFNINLLGRMQTNASYNQFLNVCDVDLTGMSSAEGWNLPAFQATGLGKWSLVLNATAHKDWATPENSILIEPKQEMREAVDNIFFHKGTPFQQGFWHNWDDEQLIAGMELAVNKYAKKVNSEGLKLQDKFTYRGTVETILRNLKH